MKTVEPNIEDSSLKPIEKKFPSIIVTIFLLVVTAVVAFSIGSINSKLQNPITQKSNSTMTKTEVAANPSVGQNQIENNNMSTFPINRSCDKNGCLFEDKSNDAIIGFATLEGYYQAHDKKDWGDVDVTCDAFVVTSGNPVLIASLLKWVKQGNTVNSVNNKGELILNIDLVSINDNYKNKIKSSTKLNPIKLDLIRTLPQGRGAPGCTSFVDIISVR